MTLFKNWPNPYLTFLIFLFVMPLSVDNAAIHHTQEAVDAIHATGAMVIFLPPYSPDLMPLEELFVQVKNWIRGNYAACNFVNIQSLWSKNPSFM